MLKRYFAAALVAGLALAAQSANATDLWFYPGHGWLAQPPFSSSTDARGSQSPTVIAGPTSSIADSGSRQAAKSQTGALPRVAAPAPYDRDGFDAGYFN